MATPAPDPRRFLRKPPPSRFKWWHFGIAWVLLDLLILGVFRPRITALLAAYRADAYAGSNVETAARTGPAGGPDRVAEHGAPSNGQVESIRAEADAQHTRIVENRALAESLLVRLKPLQDACEIMERRRSAMQSELASLKQQHEAGAAIDIEDFNAKVRIINELNASVQTAYDRYQEGFREYEKQIERDSLLVEKFNARFTGGN